MPAALGALVVLVAPLAAQGITTRVSVDSGGNQANGNSFDPSVSADGRFVAFSSFASNLVPGDTAEKQDVFVHDRRTGETQRVSVAYDGGQANGNSGHPSLSLDGRYVAFTSSATNLVPGDTTWGQDIFVHDRRLGTTVRASVSSTGAEANARCAEPRICGDGRYVAFLTTADNLVPGDGNGLKDVFLHDLLTGQTSCVSTTPGGATGNNNSFGPSISADGMRVAFCSHATDLVPGDANGQGDIFVRDLQTGVITIASVSSTGVQGDGWSTGPSLSHDGRFVAFYSYAHNLVPGDSGLCSDVFVHDSLTGQTTRVSVSSAGNEANGYCYQSMISPCGRYVTFMSPASNLVPGDTLGNRDLFMHDCATGMTTAVSIGPGGRQCRGESSSPTVGVGGRIVAYRSWDTELLLGDTNETADIFVLDTRLASATPRHAGTNPDSLSAVALPTLGGIFSAMVDLAGTTGHTFAWLAGYAAPGVELLPDGQYLLMDATNPAGELLGQPVLTGPTATYSIAIPAHPSVLGYFISMQAVHFGGGAPFALSNALDVIPGL